MVSGEMLVLIGGTAILPYVAEALYSWAQQRRRRR